MSRVGEGVRYVIEQPLGEGGMAVVHLGRMIGPAGDRRVAIKQLARTQEVSAAGQARLAAEARLVFRLTHANICQVLDLGENADGTFVVMEYVHGCDLGHLVADLEARGRQLDVAVCVYVAREVARALDYAHRHGDAEGRSFGLVHGDASPRNVLLSVEGEVKLADFGIARSMGMTAPGTGILGGTPGFIAPEVATGIVDRRSDIYSLGRALARALGERDDASAALREIVLRATARDATARFSTAGEMERALAMELSRRHPGFTPTVLADVVRRHVEEREGRTARKVLPEAATDFAIRTFRPQPAADAAPPPPPPPPIARTATVVPRDAGRPRRVRPVVVALALIGCAVAASVLLWSRGDDDDGRDDRAGGDAPAVAVTMTASPATAGPLDAGPPPRAAIAPDAAPPVRAPASEPPRSGREARGPRRPSPPAIAEPGFVTVNSTPWGVVYIDDRRVASETPLYRHPIAPGRHAIKVYYADTKRYSDTRQVDISRGQHRTIGFRR